MPCSNTKDIVGSDKNGILDLKQESNRKNDAVKDSFKANPLPVTHVCSIRDSRIPFHEKHFFPRESLLTSMYETEGEFADSTRSLYNAMAAGFLWLLVRLLLQENTLVPGGAISVGTAFINLVISLHQTSLSVFGGLTCALSHVFLLNVASLAVIPLVQLMKSKIVQPSLLVLYYLFIVLSILSYASVICLTNKTPLAPASGLMVMCEAARISMKIHAYCREKLVHGLPALYKLRSSSSPSLQDRIEMRATLLKQIHVANTLPPLSSLSSISLIATLESFRDYVPINSIHSAHKRVPVNMQTLKESQPLISIGSFNEEVIRFLFFLFAPTLVYRDSYPLDQHSFIYRLSAAMSHLFSFILTIIVGLLVMHGMVNPILYPVLSSVRSLVTTASFFLVVYELIMPSMLLFILTHYAVLHSCQNIMASLLGFADKSFYGSWWTATSWGSWYRRWNLCVGEFLWCYVYSDVQRAGYSQSKALISVFLYSALIHELILICAFKFFNPALFVFFTGPGVLLLSLTRHFGPQFANTFMWMALSLGVSLLFLVYAIEGSLRYAESQHKSTQIGSMAESIHQLAYNLIIPRTCIALFHVLKTGEFTTTTQTIS